MRHPTLLSMVFALLVGPSFAQDWRVELRSSPTAPWAPVGAYQSAEDAKTAFAALPLTGTIEGRIVTLGAPAVVTPRVIESLPRTHPTWYRFGYRRFPLGFGLCHGKATHRRQGGHTVKSRPTQHRRGGKGQAIRRTAQKGRTARTGQGGKSSRSSHRSSHRGGSSRGAMRGGSRRSGGRRGGSRR